MHYATVTPMPHAGETNNVHRKRCEAGACDQLATVRWIFVHDDVALSHGAISDNALCPEHAGVWAADYADPDSEYWLGR